jgi:hypothetical protein
MFSGNDRVFLGGDRQRKCLSSDRQNNVSCLEAIKSSTFMTDERHDRTMMNSEPIKPRIKNVNLKL